MTNVFIDLDGVLANWAKAACQLINLDFDDPNTRKLLRNSKNMLEIR
ncbi:MAG: hypothetical protein HC836_47105, partial [Richelia sp. RM2_1_2]|nr:hypothetical protein [Richelia sp. RM2_1_2]